MWTTDAVRIINTMVFRPDWKMTAKPSSRQGYVTIDTAIETQDTRKEFAPEYRKLFIARGEDEMRVDDCETQDAIYFRILTEILPRIHMHEDREFLRNPRDMEAPFHPHKMSGMLEWFTRWNVVDIPEYLEKTIGV